MLLRLIVLHCQCSPLVLILDECQFAGDRDWKLIQAVSDILVEQVLIRSRLSAISYIAVFSIAAVASLVAFRCHHGWWHSQ